MTRALMTLLLAPLALSWAGGPCDPIVCDRPFEVTVAPVPPAVLTSPLAVPTSLTGAWTLVWDDSTDLDLDSEEKACTVRLDGVGDDVVGAFSGLVQGRTREAIFTGERIGVGAPAMLVLVQREEGYACSYQLQGADGGEFRGTWQDTRGGGGTVVLRRSPSVGSTHRCECGSCQAPAVLLERIETLPGTDR